MPWNVYTQYQNYSYNGQSALLQAVKNAIVKTYPNTDVGGDGQIVNVPFTDGLHFEVLPAFKNSNGTYIYPDSNNGGSWKITNPDAEINAISYAQIYSTNNNLYNLCRMLRAWKSYNSVSIGGLLLDTFAYNFLISYQYRNQSYLYYDLMTRDFFGYLMAVPNYITSWSAVGSYVTLYKIGDFTAAATKAYNLSLEAIEHDRNGNSTLADNKWKDIYGYRITP